MADIVDVQTRSRMMAGIRARDTRPEMLLRKALHARGYRYRLCDKRLPGKPDMVFPRYKAVIFVHGCFWHGHEACHLFRLPKSNTVFWQAKIAANVARDRVVLESLATDGWRVMVVWECALKGRNLIPLEDLLVTISSWLDSKTKFHNIRGSYDER
ncbi:DNA glycosylase [Vogesella sp. EB]|uniref:very short patch repair endonuclease n=1 Tax=Vogesella sp. EB TaxID=1526735 RepID=UPI00064D3591|nr:very short patch repair endonuclease [Vogesella sp. EB]KMJ52855.1 DNA glycosylase [Vogesella sp. EB]